MLRTIAITCVLLSILFACAATPSDQTTETAQRSETHAIAPTLEELKNATYTGINAQLKTVTLHNGRWIGDPVAPGAASRAVVELAGDFRVLGDLDNKGQADAAVVLTYSSGGSGVYSYLAVVSRQAGVLRNVATTPLGDRVQIRSARIDDQRIFMSAVRAGKTDPACCGGELVDWQWTLDNGKLNALPELISGRLSLETIAGTVWALHAWNIDELAESPPVVTLVYDSNRFAGASGCNRYSGGVQSGKMPGDISLGPIAGTRMACPERESVVEARFLEQLGGARKFGFMLGRLAISYLRTDGSLGTMLFEPSATLSR